MERALAERTHHPRWEAARATVIFRDINDEVRSREQVSSRLSVLEDLADRDPLTGPLNRRGFAVARHHLTATADRKAKVCQFVFVDVDRLEAVNDAGGHAAGGAALVAVASAIQRAVRGADIAARFGGDEFVIVTIDAPASQVATIIDRIHGEMRSDPTAPAGLSLSVGVTERKPHDQRLPNDVVDEADRDMYQRRMIRRLRGAQRPAGTSATTRWWRVEALERRPSRSAVVQEVEREEHRPYLRRPGEGSTRCASSRACAAVAT